MTMPQLIRWRASVACIVRSVVALFTFPQKIFWAVQKLLNGQRGEGVNDFFTYPYVNFEGGVMCEIVT